MTSSMSICQVTPFVQSRSLSPIRLNNSELFFFGLILSDGSGWIWTDNPGDPRDPDPNPPGHTRRAPRPRESRVFLHRSVGFRIRSEGGVSHFSKIYNTNNLAPAQRNALTFFWC